MVWVGEAAVCSERREIVAPQKDNTGGVSA